MYISFFPFRSVGCQRRSSCCNFCQDQDRQLAVHLGYSGTSNGSGVQLQLLKSYKNENVSGHEESVCWLIERADLHISYH